MPRVQELASGKPASLITRSQRTVSADGVTRLRAARLMVETPLIPRPTVYGARLQRNINLQSTEQKAPWDSGGYTTPTPLPKTIKADRIIHGSSDMSYKMALPLHPGCLLTSGIDFDVARWPS
jgi:hypothetical protein